MGDTGPVVPARSLLRPWPRGVGWSPGTPEKTAIAMSKSGIWCLCSSSAAPTAMTPLPRPSVDTGMGLERRRGAQGVHAVTRLIFSKRSSPPPPRPRAPALPIPASCPRFGSSRTTSVTAFLVTDRVVPSNEGRGYVLRRIIRRALHHGHKLGCERAFFHRLVAPLARSGRSSRALAAQRRVAQIWAGRGAVCPHASSGRFGGWLANLAGRKSGDVVFKLYVPMASPWI